MTSASVRNLTGPGIEVGDAALKQAGFDLRMERMFLKLDWNPPGPLTEETTVVIEPGTGLHGIARVLADAGVVRHPLVYLAMVLAEQPRAVWQAGEYAFPPGIAPQAVTAKLTRGEVVIHRLTIPEGLTSEQVSAETVRATLARLGIG